MGSNTESKDTQYSQSESRTLALNLTPGDAEMVVSWAEEASKANPDNDVLRAACERFREAFNGAARAALRDYIGTSAFRADFERACDLLNAGDTDALAALASRHSEERARRAVERRNLPKGR